MADERIRVAHVITRMIVGGAQETVLLAAALADRSRFDPVIVCGPQTGSEGSLHDEVRRRGVELVVVPELVREVNPVKDARVVPVLTKLFRDRMFDVVHTNSSKAGIVGRVAARCARTSRVIHTVHGWPFHEHQAWQASATWKALERRAAPLAEHLVVVAESDRRRGLAAGIGRPEQYVTIRSGLELQRFCPDAAARCSVRQELGIPEAAVVIGGLGRLSPQKDPMTLLGAALPVLATRPDTHLLLVGDGPLRPAVEETIAGSGLAARVHVVGLRVDVPRLFNGMDVFVLSSRWEGLPRTVIQAMATGVPVVSTDIDGVRDVVQEAETGLLAPRGDARRLGNALARVVDDRQLASKLADLARQGLKDFDAEVTTRQLEALYSAAGRPA